MKTSFVLLVDDDEFQLEFIGDMLRDLGVVKVLTATGDHQGLALFDALERKPIGKNNGRRGSSQSCCSIFSFFC